MLWQLFKNNAVLRCSYADIYISEDSSSKSLILSTFYLNIVVKRTIKYSRKRIKLFFVGYSWLNLSLIWFCHIKINYSPKSCSNDECHSSEIMVEKISIEVGWFTLFLVVIWFLLIEKIFVDKMRSVKLVLPCVWSWYSPLLFRSTL